MIRIKGAQLKKFGDMGYWVVGTCLSFFSGLGSIVQSFVHLTAHVLSQVHSVASDLGLYSLLWHLFEYLG